MENKWFVMLLFFEKNFLFLWRLVWINGFLIRLLLLTRFLLLLFKERWLIDVLIDGLVKKIWWWGKDVGLLLGWCRFVLIWRGFRYFSLWIMLWWLIEMRLSLISCLMNYLFLIWTLIFCLNSMNVWNICSVWKLF